jgi:hypothetical protein
MLKRHEIEILLKAGHGKAEVARLRAPAATTSSCSARRIGWNRFVRSRGRSVSTSTKSHCPGLTRAFAFCRHTSTSS